MRRWPWITLVLGILAVLSPPGRDIIYAAFLSNEQMSRNIWQPIALIALALLALLVGLEWWIRRIIQARRARQV